MYIDILLGLVFIVSLYILWQRIAHKIPELAAIPDKEVSVLLEENTAKLHRFILHLFHFRIFYRERHYQDKFWSFAAKVIFKIHIFLLRLDNGLMSILKKMRTSTEGMESGNMPGEYTRHLPEEAGLPDESQRKNPMQEVRPRKRTHIAGVGGDEGRNSHIELSKTVPRNVNESAGVGIVRLRRPALSRGARRDTNHPALGAFARSSEVKVASFEDQLRARVHSDEKRAKEKGEVDI